jgi:hypothetical protein
MMKQGWLVAPKVMEFYPVPVLALLTEIGVTLMICASAV